MCWGGRLRLLARLERGTVTARILRHHPPVHPDYSLGLGLSDVVERAGSIKDTRPLVASADIGVQTSRTEGLSVARLEQMMAGLTVVATDAGETRHALDHGRGGLLVQPGDLGGLIDALRIESRRATSASVWVPSRECGH